LPSQGSSILGLAKEISLLGPRLPGTEAERKCLSLVSQRLARLGLSFEMDGFEFLDWHPIRQEFIGPDGDSLQCSQLGYSPSGSFKAEIAYCGYGEADDFSDARGRIAVVESGWEGSRRFLHRIQKYRNAVDAGAGAFVLVGQPGRSAPRGIIRKRRLGQIPAISVPYNVGRTIVGDSGRGIFAVTAESETAPAESANLVVDLGGLEPGVLLSAHVDSWTEGAWDNASGTALLLQLCSVLASKPTKHRLSLLFCGAEELGLFGSRRFVEQHKGEYAFAVNVDGVGLRGSRLQVRCSNPSLSKIPPLRGIYSELPLTPWGDHWSFHQAGIQTFFVTTNGANQIQHTEEDGPDCLDEKELESALHLVFKIVRYLDSII